MEEKVKVSADHNATSTQYQTPMWHVREDAIAAKQETVDISVLVGVKGWAGARIGVVFKAGDSVWDFEGEGGSEGHCGEGGLCYGT